MCNFLRSYHSSIALTIALLTWCFVIHCTFVQASADIPPDTGYGTRNTFVTGKPVRRDVSYGIQLQFNALVSALPENVQNDGDLVLHSTKHFTTKLIRSILEHVEDIDGAAMDEMIDRVEIRARNATTYFVLGGIDGSTVKSVVSLLDSSPMSIHTGKTNYRSTAAHMVVSDQSATTQLEYFGGHKKAASNTHTFQESQYVLTLPFDGKILRVEENIKCSAVIEIAAKLAAHKDELPMETMESAWIFKRNLSISFVRQGISPQTIYGIAEDLKKTPIVAVVGGKKYTSQDAYVNVLNTSAAGRAPTSLYKVSKVSSLSVFKVKDLKEKRSITSTTPEP